MQLHFGFVIRWLFLSQKWESNRRTYRFVSINYKFRSTIQDKIRVVRTNIEKTPSLRFTFSSSQPWGFLDDLSMVRMFRSITQVWLILHEARQALASIFDYPTFDVSIVLFLDYFRNNDIKLDVTFFDNSRENNYNEYFSTLTTRYFCSCTYLQYDTK